ncbi:hypothetical protein ACIRP7_35100, partial [Streptomyces sp. NPDC102270]|uniref:hypothetical protein n=1 Tax=Streptomyces sp. NPDC102270 TaxID=3366150 RepID=UPI00381A8313
RDGALTSITEATELYRTLAAANPAAFLPNLAGALNNLSNQQSERQLLDDALRTYDQAISELPSGPQAELLVSRARWRHVHDDHIGAAADLLSAAQRADDTTESAWAGRSRRAVRELAEELARHVLAQQSLGPTLPNLPAWSKDELPSEAIDRFNSWLSARSWPDQETFVRQTYPLLAAPEGRAALALTRALYPEFIGLSDLAVVLDAAHDRGLDLVLEELRETNARSDLVNEWLATPTWPADLEFLNRHPRLTEDPLVRELLTSQWDDPASRQHLGILQLTDRLPAPDVYDAITDPATAIDTAMEFVEQGQPDALLPLLLASPALTQMPFVTPYLIAVHTAFSTPPAAETPQPEATPDTNDPSPTDLIEQAATQGSEVQRGAGAARLRRLAQHHPDHAPTLLQLAAALTAAAPAPQSETASDAG